MEDTMIKTAAFALTAALLGIAPPALAEPAKSAPEPSQQVDAMPAAKAVTKRTQYCVLDYYPSSRVPIKQCNTRAGWLAQGFDPLAK
jgi:hypothetical protein